MAPGVDTPCFKIVDCWWETFDVTAYLKSCLPKETVEKLLEDRTPPNRLQTILDLVERFRNQEPGQQKPYQTGEGDPWTRNRSER
jgi:hypothetical protein